MSHNENQKLLEQLSERFEELQYKLIEAEDDERQELLQELEDIEEQIERLNISHEEIEMMRQGDWL